VLLVLGVNARGILLSLNREVLWLLFPPEVVDDCSVDSEMIAIGLLLKGQNKVISNEY